MLKSVLIAILTLVGIEALAKEGLLPGPAPGFLNSCWNAAVSVNYMGPNGSGAIVGVNRINDEKYDVYVLTAYHVANQHPYDLKSPLELFSINLEEHLTGKELDGSSKVLAEGASGIKSLPESDLSILRFEIRRQFKVNDSGDLEETFDPFGDRLGLLKNFAVPKIAKCAELRPGNEVYAIGFPKTYRLPQTSRNTQRAPQINVFQKRWSEGVLSAKMRVANYLSVHGVRNPKAMAVSSADVIVGNSGGPMCDRSGDIIGIASGGSAATVHGHGDLYTAPCSDIAQFVESAVPTQGADDPRNDQWRDSCVSDRNNTGTILWPRILWEKPSAGGLNLGTTTQGQSIDIVTDQAPWMQIRISADKVGWVPAYTVKKCKQKPFAYETWRNSCLSEFKRPGVVFQERAIRERESDGKVLGHTFPEQAVEILSDKKPWIQIRTSEGLIGWVPFSTVIRCP